MSLDQVGETIKNKRNFKDYSYSITFDDGFYNNYKFAAPILSDLNIHSTFYICTDFILNNKMSWIDRIDSVVEESQGAKIKLPWGIMKFNNTTKSKIIFLTKIRKIIKTNFDYDPIKFADYVQNILIKYNFDESNIIDIYLVYSTSLNSLLLYNLVINKSILNILFFILNLFSILTTVLIVSKYSPFFKKSVSNKFINSLFKFILFCISNLSLSTDLNELSIFCSNPL